MNTPNTYFEASNGESIIQGLQLAMSKPNKPNKKNLFEYFSTALYYLENPNTETHKGSQIIDVMQNMTNIETFFTFLENARKSINNRHSETTATWYDSIIDQWLTENGERWIQIINKLNTQELTLIDAIEELNFIRSQRKIETEPIKKSISAKTIEILSKK